MADDPPASAADPPVPAAAAPAAPDTRVRLKVTNGDLSFADWPVVVGHYIGDSIYGSTGQLNESLGGSIRTRYALGAFPGPIGTAIVAHCALGSDRMGVVVGLGDMGTFNAFAVRTGIVAGLLELALAKGGTGVSLVMLGARAGLIPTGDILAAMLGGICEAQRRIADQELTPFTDVQIISQMEDSAHLAWHHVKRLCDQARYKEVFDLHDQLVFSKGALRRVARVEDSNSWRAIQISGAALPDGTHGLHFAALGGLARAEGYLTPDNTRMIGALLDGAIGKGGTRVEGATPGRALFELTWPPELKRISHEDRHLRLLVDDIAAALPFELMDDRQLPSGDGPGEQLPPPAVRYGMLRQLLQRQFGQLQPNSVSRRTALVIGDPRGGQNCEGQFGQLDGARAEANAVADLLERPEYGYDVTRLIGDAVTPVQVVEAVLRGGWTIIHIAGHGIYDWHFKSDMDAAAASGSKDPIPRYTGVVLADRVTLSPAMLQGMTDPPALAFINCCQLGRIEGADEAERRKAGRPEFAASFAGELIALGTSAVVAAGWNVDDGGALTFAKTLYPLILDSVTGFGDAVRLARAAVYDYNPVNTTWGAYQCYGEPDWQLGKGTPQGHGSDGTVFASHVEVLAALSNLRNDADIGAGRDDRTAEIAAQLEKIEAVVTAGHDHNGKERDWQGRDYVAESLGKCHAALGNFARAIGWYEVALKRGARPSLKLIEQLASLRIKTAALPGADGVAPSPQQALATIDAARKTLTGLCEVAGESGERLALIGSAWKREAVLLAGKAADAALAEAAAAYDRGWTLAREKTPNDTHYPAINTVVCKVLLGLRGGGAVIAPGSVEMAALAAAVGTDCAPGDHWRAGSQVGLKLLQALTAGALDDAGRDELVEAYRNCWREGGTALDLNTRFDQLDFIEAMLSPKKLAKQRDWVAAIEAALKGAPILSY